MKFLIALIVILSGCAHSDSRSFNQGPSRRDLVLNKAVVDITGAIEKNPVGYGSMIQGARFLKLVDLNVDKEGEAGFAIIEAMGEQHEPIGRIYIYFFCGPDMACKPIQYATKSREAPKGQKPQGQVEDQRL